MNFAPGVFRAAPPVKNTVPSVPNTLKGVHDITKQNVSRRHGLLARAIRGNRTPPPDLPTPQDAT